VERTEIEGEETEIEGGREIAPGPGIGGQDPDLVVDVTGLPPGTETVREDVTGTRQWAA